MCGIAGILSLDGGGVDRARLERMRDVLAHRGPDDAGVMLGDSIGLSHRRLSIIDLSTGHQPMASRSGDTWITYNGEIYNFRELRAELEAWGCIFRTHSDTEVILEAYETFGEDCVQRLRGMFAFAIWDARRGRLFLARDRLGIKPLYYARREREFLFASEIKALLASGAVRPIMNRAVLPEFLATRFVAGDETFFRGVCKLLPGRTLSWSREDGFSERRYWSPPAEIDASDASLEERAAELAGRLEDAVRSHLVSDVPVGLFLSGGLDSSGLAALMAPMVGRPIQSFAVGFAEREYNDLDYARLAARAVGAEHREVVVSPREFFSALPRLVWHEDKPIAFPSSIALYFVSRLAQAHVKVVMTGEGSDELFLGYNRYRVAAWNERLGRPYWALAPASLQAGVRALLDRLPRRLRRYAERSFLGPAPGARGQFYENFAVFPEPLRRALLGSTAGRDPYAEAMRCYAEAPAGMLERMCHADLQTYLVELLMKQDRMSMAASVESRVPFLDHELVEYAAAMPGRYKLRGWRTKSVLREALKGRVPTPILTRRKMGFPVPIGRWLRGPFWPLVEEFVLGPRTLGRGLFDVGFLRQLAEEHRSGRGEHGDRLWLLMNLEIWQRVFLEGEDTEGVMVPIVQGVELGEAA